MPSSSFNIARAFCFAIAGMLASFGGIAQALDPDRLARAELLPGWTRSDGLRVAAIRLDLAEGWKTYWRAPGQNGIPPAFDWSGSSNLAQVGYFWPSPTVFDTYGSPTIGYENQMVLPVLLRPKDPSLPIEARLEMEFGLCSDICIAASAEMATFVPADGEMNKPDIQAAIADRPESGKSAGLTVATCRVSGAEDGYLLSSELTFVEEAPAPLAVVIESGSESIWISEPDHTVAGHQMVLQADVMNFGSGAFSFDRSRVVITIIREYGAIEVRGCSG